MGWGGVGWGGAMLTFLVLRTLYVATLQRSLVLLIRCIHERLGWGSKSKDLLLYVKCWQWQYVNLHARLQQKNISTLKRLVWKDSKKRLSNWSRENLAKFGSYKCAFRCSENNINKKKQRCFYEHGSQSAGMFLLRHIPIRISFTSLELVGVSSLGWIWGGMEGGDSLTTSQMLEWWPSHATWTWDLLVTLW